MIENNTSNIHFLSQLQLVNGDDCGIYVHIPFCKSKCAYCSFCSISDLSLQERYISALEGEILSTFRPDKFNVRSIYVGGGTPSCLFRGALTKIFNALKRVYVIDTNAEITIEANPESCSVEFLQECRACGVNRVSMGMQSLDDNVLRAINRLHDRKTYMSAIKRVRDCGFTNVSTDIILGLPFQDNNDILNCISVASDYCSHVSVYALSVEEGTPLFDANYSVDDDLVADAYDFALNKLELNGFKRYEVSNFARNDRFSRHNSNYWRCLPYVGYGVAAHGYDGWRIRYYHATNVSEYIERPVIQVVSLSDKDLYNEYVMLALRTVNGINKNDFEKRFGKSFLSVVPDAIDYLFERGWVIDNGNSVIIAPDKLFVMNGIIEELMY